MYNDDAGYPEDSEKLGRYLGPTEPGIGSVMSFIILHPRGRVVHRTTVLKLTPQELEDKTHAKLRETFDRDVASKLGDPMTEAELSMVKGHEKDKSASQKISAVTPEYEAYKDEHERQQRMPKVDGFDQETYDAYVLAQVQLPKGDDMAIGTIVKRKRDHDGNPVGRHDVNPIFDTRICKFEFPDGKVLEYAANQTMSQVDEEGHHQVIFDDIVDHKGTDEVMAKSDDNLYVTVNGRKHRRITTKGWKLYVLWKDGTTSWEPLSDLKEAYPIQTAEYAVANKLDHYPAFAWWVGPTLRRRNRIIASASNKRYHKRMHKFGIELPKTVKEALEIDRQTGTTYWRDALKLEMDNV
jgi:hypothetical protein